MKTTILTALLAVIQFFAHAQEKANGIYFGAILGTQRNEFNRHFNVDIEPELYSFAIGAGSAWTKHNFVIGFEFLYASAQKDNAAGHMQCIGFSNTLSCGYNVLKAQSWKLEPTIGIVVNNNQLISQSKTNASTQNLVNNPINGNIGINFKVIDKKGLFTGVKFGYILPLAGDTEWKFKIDEKASGIKDNMGAFYLQLNIGGFLNFNNK